MFGTNTRSTFPLTPEQAFVQGCCLTRMVGSTSSPRSRSPHMAAVVTIDTLARPRPSAAPSFRARPSRRHRSAAVYARRRFVAVAVGLGILAVLFQAGAALGGTDLAPVERRPDVVSVTVEPGDTLW